MADDFITPRANFASLGNYIGHNVRLVAQISQPPTQGKAVVISSDGGTITVNTLPQSEGSWTDNFVEIIGKVTQDMVLIELYSTNLGNNFGKYLLHFESFPCCQPTFQIFNLTTLLLHFLSNTMKSSCNLIRSGLNKDFITLIRFN